MQEQHNSTGNPRSPKDYLRLILTGFAMGSADIVPGVSGGTMAFILGVYETLLDAIKSFNLEAVRLLLRRQFKAFEAHVSLRFLVALGLGIAAAIIALSGLLSNLLEGETSRIFVFAFFFGLVIASIIAVSTQVKWSVLPLVALVVGTVVAFVIVNVVPVDAPHEPLNLFLSGMVAICAMILPGISGSFILLILGQYDYVLTAVSNRNIPPLIFLAAGCVVGIIGFSRILSWLLKRYHHITVAALVGFMVGSLWKIWPWKSCVLSDIDRHGDIRCLQESNLLPNFGSPEFLVALALLLVGFLLVSLIDHMQSRSNPVIGLVWRRQPVIAPAKAE